MTLMKYFSICKWFDRIARTNESDRKVAVIKKNTFSHMEDATASVRKATKLQNQILNRTTTYYIGRAAGVIK